MAEKRTDIMEFIIRNNFIFNIPHFCVNGRVIFQKQGPKCWLFVDMRLKNQYYCIFVFNNNYITGSSAYEGGYRKTDMKQERRTGFYPVRLSTLGRSAGIRTRGLMDPNHARYQTSPHPVHTMDTIIAVLPPVVKRGNLLRIAKVVGVQYILDRWIKKDEG